MDESPLILPSLRRELKIPTTKTTDIIVPESKITDTDEKTFERHMADFDAKSQDVIGRLNTHIAQVLTEQAINPTNMSNFIEDPDIYKEVMREIRAQIKNDDISTTKKLDLADKKSEDDVKDQLTALIKAYGESDKLQKLGYYLDQNATVKNKIRRDDMDLIITQERLQYWSPDKIAEDILDREKGKLTKPQENMLNEIIENMERDRIAREHNYLTDDVFVNKISNYNDLIITNIFGSDLNKLKRIENKFRRKMFIDLNILKDQINDIEGVIAHAPANKISISLRHTVDNTLRDMKNGKINLSQAFDRINGANKLLKATAPETLAQKQLTRIKERKEIENKEIIKPEIYFEDLRRRQLFAFQGVEVDVSSKSGYKGTQFADEVYSIDPTSKSTIASYVKNALDEKFTTPTAPNVPFRDIKTVDLKSGKMTKDDISKIIYKVVNHMTSHKISFMDRDFPILRKITDKKKITDRKEEVVNEFGKLYDTLIDMEKYLADYGKVPMIPESSVDYLSLGILPAVGEKVEKPTKKIVISLADRAVEMRPSSEFKDEGATPADVEKNRLKREKKYSHENLKYTKKFDKEVKEELRAQYGENVFEYDIKTEDQLLRMKQSVSKMSGKLFIINLKTGQLFPIDLDKTFINQTYIFMKNPEKGGSFAEYPALHKIYRDEDKIIPYKSLQYGRDKRAFRFHKAHRNPYTIDYRDQIDHEIGAGFWKSVRSGINKHIINPSVDYVKNKTVNAANEFARQSVSEGKNFIKQEKKNIREIGKANREFYRNPSFSGLNNAINSTVGGVGKLALQPAFTSARELSNISDFAGNVPGLNAVKFGLEYSVPGLAVADAAVHAVKNLGVGSNDKAKYLDAAINTLDAITGSGKLSGSAQLGARILDTGLTVTDKFVDKHNP